MVAGRCSALGAIETDAVTGFIISGCNGIPNEPVVVVTIGIDSGPTLGQEIVLASLKVLEEASNLGLRGVNAIAQAPFAVILVGPQYSTTLLAGLNGYILGGGGHGNICANRDVVHQDTEHIVAVIVTDSEATYSTTISAQVEGVLFPCSTGNDEF